jgi:hypothetical protein
MPDTIKLTYDDGNTYTQTRTGAAALEVNLRYYSYATGTPTLMHDDKLVEEIEIRCSNLYQNHPPTLYLQRYGDITFHLDEVKIMTDPKNSQTVARGFGFVAKEPRPPVEATNTTAALLFAAPDQTDDVAIYSLSHKTPSYSLTVRVKRIA